MIRYVSMLSCALGAWWTLAAHAAAPACSSRHYSVWIVPQLPAVVTYRAWSPLLARLSRQTGLCFGLHVSSTFGEFETNLINGRPDFAFLNPYHEVMARKAQGYEPLVHDHRQGLAGVIVVRRDSAITDIHGLEGAIVAFPAPNAYAASLLPRAYLRDSGVRFTPRYVGSHSNVYRAVAMGDAPAGGGANSTFLREPKELRQQLRILYTTPPSMPHPFAAHPRVPAAVRQQVTGALLRLTGDEAGRRLLEGVQMPEPVRADYVRDYAPLERLGLEDLVVREPR